MGKVIYQCAVEGCTCKRKVRVKGVHGTSTQFWLCKEHDGSIGNEKKRRKNKAHMPEFRRSRDYSAGFIPDPEKD